ncbi:EF-P beta-lysylation protein EpmB [Paraphotobacterium marinum]|uniref:L-lysine 2,3-aminomutase n=1 Tax=Paraphotobacterium marinum TaxID=1755811 RepID=A0A220VDA3_9GAMM|nr:EF-P beta-lysylation protein EpmB [Paraphotobacterium marinum]ASK78251.1 EF-P beta-lysylation protein EpmB [Paraphotobacterium marinum]
MNHMITQNEISVEQNWLFELKNSISSPKALLEILQIDENQINDDFSAKKLFPMRVPLSFVNRMNKQDPKDPLLMQVLPVMKEFEVNKNFTKDPLKEQKNQITGLLHKYKNRVLIMFKTGCAINCRYCFRRHFPYQENSLNKNKINVILEYIKQNSSINEVILSGGDPLMAKDHEIKSFLEKLSYIKTITTLRIHTRLPVVIPSRITDSLVKILCDSPLKIVIVTHINHPNEINDEFSKHISKLKNITILNQSVFLKGINNDSSILKNLSDKLFHAGILPYYIHATDAVEGTSHFFVPDSETKKIMRELLTLTSGYLVPKLVRENAGELSKTPIDLF